MTSTVAKFLGPSQPSRKPANGSSAPTRRATAWEALDVAVAAALGHEPPAGPKRRVEAMKQGVVVADPVEDGVRERRLHRLVEDQLGQIGLQHGRPRPELRPGRSTMDGAASTATTCPRGSRSSSRRDAAAATAGVEDPLVAAGAGARAPPAPTPPAVGDAIVGRRVPVARRGGGHRAVVTGPGRSRSRS